MNTIEEDILITKAISGEALPDELILLENWRKASVSNEKKYVELEKIWHHAAQLATEIDTEVAWQKVKLRTEQQQFVIPLYKQTWIRIAAIFAVITTLGWFGYQFAYNPLVTIQTTSLEQKEILLPDGSKVWLNENSHLSYHKKMIGKERNVELAGEAFFDIVKNPEQPFVIEAQQARTEVLGTSFNLRVMEGTLEAELSVIEGKVRFTSSGNQEQTIALAGQKVRISSTGKFEKDVVAASSNDLAWKTRKLVFNNSNLKEVFTTLENYFNIKIVVDNSQIFNCHFTAEFDNPKLEKILEVLDRTLQLTHIQKSKTITIKGKGCQP